MILEIVTDNGPVFLAALHWLESTITLNTSGFPDTTLMPMDWLNGYTMKSEKPSSRPAMEMKHDGPEPPTPSFGPNESQSSNEWVVHHSLEHTEHILYFR
jgi:hypothetical protein